MIQCQSPVVVVDRHDALFEPSLFDGDAGPALTLKRQGVALLAGEAP